MPEETQEQVQEGLVPEPPLPEEPPKEAPQYLTREEAKALLTEAFAEGQKKGWSETQASKDRQIAEALRRAQGAEEQLKVYESSFGGLDEETQRDIELKRTRSQVQFYQSAQQQEALQRQQEAYAQQLNASLVAHLESLGIDKTDKGVDWAQDATDYLKGRARFDASVAKILKEKTKEAEAKLGADFKTMESKMRRDLGLDSVDTSISGAVVEGIPTDPVKFRQWIATISQEEYEKHASKVTELRRQGKI